MIDESTMIQNHVLCFLWFRGECDFKLIMLLFFDVLGGWYGCIGCEASVQVC